MTKKQAIWAVGVGAAAVAVLIVAHLFLFPADASWKLNRILHHVWQGVVGLSAVGGGAWALWPRPKARRRDFERRRAHRRLITVGLIVVLAVVLVMLSEVRRDWVAREFLDPAGEDLQAIGKALDAYAADHEGAMPVTWADLAPRYLPAERLHYAYRDGPRQAPPSVGGEGAGPSPGYALVKVPPGSDEQEQPRGRRIAAYLKPGNAWAPLTVVLDRHGAPRIVGEDVVARFEAEARDRRARE